MREEVRAGKQCLPGQPRLPAVRTHLAQANAAAKAVRDRATKRRLAACRRNLLRASRAGLKSPRYAGRFCHGLYCLSLRRSMRLAQESARKLARHLKRFRRAYAPKTRTERRLVQALGETVWRRLRALRGQARWEMRAVSQWLRRAAEAARNQASSAGRASNAGRTPRRGAGDLGTRRRGRWLGG